VLPRRAASFPLSSFLAALCCSRFCEPTWKGRKKEKSESATRRVSLALSPLRTFESLITRAPSFLSGEDLLLLLLLRLSLVSCFHLRSSTPYVPFHLSHDRCSSRCSRTRVLYLRSVQSWKGNLEQRGTCRNLAFFSSPPRSGSPRSYLRANRGSKGVYAKQLSETWPVNGQTIPYFVRNGAGLSAPTVAAIIPFVNDLSELASRPVSTKLRAEADPL